MKGREEELRKVWNASMRFEKRKEWELFSRHLKMVPPVPAGHPERNKPEDQSK